MYGIVSLYLGKYKLYLQQSVLNQISHFLGKFFKWQLKDFLWIRLGNHLANSLLA